jgi:hypothetical protein
MTMHRASTAFLTCILAAPALAGSELPFEVRSADTARGQLELAPRPDVIAQLAGERSAELAGFPLSDGTSVELELERLDVARLGFGLHVDGSPALGLMEGLELSVWHGRVRGEPQSQVALSFSQEGLYGWVLARGELHHLMSRGADQVWLVSERRLVELGGEPGGARCATDELAENVRAPRVAPAGGTIKAGSPSLYECPIAIETDYQLFQVFGNNLGAESAYVTSLLTWSSYRYEEQIGTVQTFPYVQFYTTSNDPWHAQDNGGNCIDVLYEFQAAWANNVPAGGKIGHMLSGANLGCGVAWLPGVCGEPWNFSVSGNMDGSVSFPVQVSPANWDFMVYNHEVGHNFNAPHTHDYCPPLDQCAPDGYFGGCQSQQVCTNQGTIMSYCHLCPGGLSNITTYFHPVSVDDMRSWVEGNCLPLYAADPVTYCLPKINTQGCAPLIGWSGHPTITGLDDFEVTAELVINNKNGLLFYGPSAAAIPFHGGTLCVGAPIKRTVGQNSAGNPPPNDCSGTYSYHWSETQLGLFGAGTTVYAQYWYRDPLATAGDGLTDALSFTVFN